MSFIGANGLGNTWYELIKDSWQFRIDKHSENLRQTLVSGDLFVHVTIKVALYDESKEEIVSDSLSFLLKLTQIRAEEDESDDENT